ncbi:hypothetical protein [Leifsonia shinshuensis]|uniref:Uncharacterized protein n=1 Tax=Leifsonia shinshuensis TaxID=150026 RepID=A0A853D001_9MICO|nr:hypothetical protein [Leifsonia shinshuensis]NYJ24871.1 hypothetical protein [Leifsonia shinshuensis]
MGIFDSISRAFGGLSSLSDAELEEKREALRLRYVASRDVDEATELYNELYRYDDEMTRRANEACARDNPDATTRYREHGFRTTIRVATFHNRRRSTDAVTLEMP